LNTITALSTKVWHAINVKIYSKILHAFTSFYSIAVDIMGKESLCPGCKHKFQNGQPYSMHIKSCRDIVSAVEKALKKHKILSA
jgi:hypothetical protein